MKKILLPLIALAAFAAPQSTPVASAAPLCENGSVSPVVVGVRCYAGEMCTVYVRYDLEDIDGDRQRYCI